MTKASDNEFPSLLIKEGTAPSSPAAGDQRVYLDSTSHKLTRKNSSGIVTTIEGIADQGTVTYIDFTTASAPSSPSAGSIRVYSKTGDTLAQKTSGGTETVFGAGGGGTPTGLNFTKTYAQFSGNTTSLAATITAAASGQRLVVVIGSYGRDVNTPTCTNVTFTEVLATNFSTGTYLSVYVGVVAGGSSGTSVTITATGSNWIIADIYEIADALTPTAGSSVTLTDTDASSKSRVAIGALTASAGDFFVIAAAQNDGTVGFANLRCNHALIDTGIRGANDALTSGIGRAVSSKITGYYTGGSSGGDLAAGIIIVS